MSVNFEKTQELAAVEAPTRAYTMPRVNLMPPEIGAADSFRRTQFILGGVGLAVLAGLAAGYGLSVMDLSKANEGLAAEQATSSQLATEEAKYAQVPKVLGDIDDVKNAQAQAMTTDIAWYAQLDAINAELPAGMTFKSLTMTINDGMGSTAPVTENPLAEEGAIGSISVEGTTPTYAVTADWLDIEGKHPGFIDQYYTQADMAYDDAKKVNEVKLTTSFSFTNELFTHNHDWKAN